MQIRAASITDIKIVLNLLGKNKENHNFYSDIDGNILKYVLTKNCYLINAKENTSGIVLLNNFKKNVSFIPSDKKDLSFFRLIYLLKKLMNLSGYKLTVHYKNLNILNIQKYFSFYIINNFKQMCFNLSDYSPINLTSDQIKIRNLVTKSEAAVRVNLQNEIFGHIKGRPELTLKEVLEESKEPGFLEEFCFILEFDKEPVGYGQVIFMSDNYYLVNFGIIPVYREKGLGIIFVNQILKICKNDGIENLYLKVDSTNDNAISLYKKAGFKDISNVISIML